ncbi:MAG: hypothetical protein D4R64_09950, partial [Porphyromonadaceae bacterium]
MNKDILNITTKEEMHKEKLKNILSFFFKFILLIIIQLPLFLYFYNEKYVDYKALVYFASCLLGAFVFINLLRFTYTPSNPGYIIRFMCSEGEYTSCKNTVNAKLLLNPFKSNLANLGLLYMLFNLLIIDIGLGFCNYNSLLSICKLLNILALPITLLSIIIQYFKIKSWCPMCLIAILSIWVGSISLFNFKILPLEFLLMKSFILAFVSVLLFSLLACYFTRGYLIKLGQNEEYLNNYMRLKRDQSFFYNILKSQKTIGEILVEKELCFGYSEGYSDTIILIVSPICKFCKIAQKALIEHINRSPKRFRIIVRFRGSLENNNGSDKIIDQTINYILHDQQEKALSNLENCYDQVQKMDNVCSFTENKDEILNERAKQIRHEYYHWLKDFEIAGSPRFIYNDKLIPIQYSYND